MDKFINKLNFDFQINQKILNLISQIDLYKGKWNSIEKQENIYLKELRKIATIESIGSSTRIEGGTLTDKEIEELLNDVKITKLKTRNEQEVVGYYDTLAIIYENYGNIKLSENYIKQLHQSLLRHSDKDTRHRGEYKSLSNKVVANYPGRIQKVIFNTTEVHLVSNEMNDLINWTNTQFKSKEIHPLIIVANLVYAPETILGLGKNNETAKAILRGWSFAPIVTIQSGAAYSAGIDDDLWGANGSRIFPGVSRNGFSQPYVANVDLRISRRFNFSESKSLEILAEGFNIFNRQNITGVNTRAYIRPFTASNDLNFNTSPNAGGTFGDPTSAGSNIFRERQIQFAARFKF